MAFGAFTTLSGQWARNTYYEPDRAKLHTADPAHGETDAPDTARYAYEAPPGEDLGEAGEFPGSEYVDVLSGVLIDTTPTTHDGGDTMPVYASDLQMQQASGAAHGTDYGASHAQNHHPPSLDFASEKYVHQRYDSFGPQDQVGVSPVALQRGLNALAENNPDGFRPGVQEHWRVDRKFNIGQRVYDLRPLWLNTAYQEADVPPPADPNPATPSFSSLARAITNVAQRPQLRREPPGLAESILTDGAADAAGADVADWVVI